MRLEQDKVEFLLLMGLCSHLFAAWRRSRTASTWTLPSSTKRERRPTRWTEWSWWATSRTAWPSWWMTWLTPAAPSAMPPTSRCRFVRQLPPNLESGKLSHSSVSASQADWCRRRKSLCHPDTRHFLRPGHLAHQQRPLRGGGGDQHHPTGGEDEGVSKNTGMSMCA